MLKKTAAFSAATNQVCFSYTGINLNNFLARKFNNVYTERHNRYKCVRYGERTKNFIQGAVLKFLKPQVVKLNNKTFTVMKVLKVDNKFILCN